MDFVSYGQKGTQSTVRTVAMNHSKCIRAVQRAPLTQKSLTVPTTALWLMDLQVEDFRVVGGPHSLTNANFA